MQNKLKLALALIVLFLSADAMVASGAVSMGVKEGDWIEYEVAFTGDSSFGHDVVWARLDVAAVQGNAFTVNITTKSSSGELTKETYSFDLETGELGDDFIIPANLNKGDTFFNKNQGNITITGSERKTLLGAERTVLTASVAESTYHWDKVTGVTVEANSTYSTYTIATKAIATNMWQPEILGLEPAAFVLVTVAAFAVVAALVFTVLSRRRRHRRHQA